MRESMEIYPRTAAERAMKLQEVLLRATTGKIKWWQAAELTGISERQMRRVLGFLEGGVKDGATAITGGGRSRAPELANGYFIEPTLLDLVPRGSKLEQEEIFGPVLTVTTFDTVDEAIAIANGTPYGLVTGIWTKDLSKALTVATAVKSGQVRVNAYSVEGSIGLPFGGYKRSGFGREQGVEALANYTQIKNVMINFG